MKKNNYAKTKNLYKIIFILVVFLGIGYAFLEANLNIEGDTTVIAPELNTYVQSVAVTTGSTSGTPTIIGNNKIEVDFSTVLTNDSTSFFEETTTLVNKGTKKSYLKNIDIKVYDAGNNEVTLAVPYEYTITHGDGTAITIGEEIDIDATPTYKFKFNYITGTNMTTVTDYPTYTFKITYNFVTIKPITVCANNDNFTTLSTTKCTANENITIPSGTICKRAINLHQEECTKNDQNNYCSGAGYSQGDMVTYGSCGTQQANPVSGDAFTCDVNGDGEFDELTERFYYVSDYYDTTNKTFDTQTAVLIYYNNVTGGESCNVDIYDYDSSNRNWYGPVVAKEQLPTTTQWTNVSLKSNTRAILAENGSTHNSASTYGGTLPTAYSYSGYAARLLTAQELMSGCGMTTVGTAPQGELDSCSYLVENTKYSQGTIDAYWLETPKIDDTKCIFHVNGIGRYVGYNYSSYSSVDGIRPVIEVPKTNISY